MIKSTVYCVECNEDYDIMVDPTDLKRWYDGEFIQVALDYLTDDERELLMSGTCGKCWDKLFPEDQQILTDLNLPQFFRKTQV